MNQRSVGVLQAEVGQTLDAEDVSRQLPLSEVVLFYDVSLEELLVDEVRRLDNSRSLKAWRPPGPTLTVRVSTTDTVVRVSEETCL